MQKQAYIATNGCLSAQTDVSSLRSSLSRGGYTITNDLGLADVVVLSLCGVTDFSAQTRSQQLYQDTDAGRKAGSLLVVSGCLPGMDNSVKDLMPNADYFVPISELGNLDTLLGLTHDSLPPTYQSDGRLYIKVENGCLDKCTYCAIPNARGRLHSSSIDQIVGVAETYARERQDPTIVLVGEDVGAYGRDQKTTIIDLLSALFSSVEGFKTKIDVVNPWWFIMYSELQPILREGTEQQKFIPSFGLPLQSASNKVLRDMRRPYTVEQYGRILAGLHTIPGFSPTTDILVGFPTESETDFRQTQEFLARNMFSHYGIWAFSARPNTAAAKFEQHDGSLVKHRQEEIVKQVIEQIAAKQHVSVEDLIADLRKKNSRLPISVNAQLTLGSLVKSDGVVLYDGQGAVRYEPIDTSGVIAYDV